MLGAELLVVDPSFNSQALSLLLPTTSDWLFTVPWLFGEDTARVTAIHSQMHRKQYYELTQGRISIRIHSLRDMHN